jgi:hypothetical protein
VRPDTLSALSEALGVTLDYIVGAGRSSAPMFEHRALLYDSEEAFVDTAGPFLADGIELGEATLAVTTKANVELLREHLGPDAGKAEFVEAESWYGEPGSTLIGYRTFSNRMLDQGAPWVRIVGEPVWEGRSDSEVRSWTRYESMLNLAFAALPVTLVCPYDRRLVDPEIVSQAQLTHPHMAGPDGVVSSAAYADPAAFVLESQQQPGARDA